MSPETNIEKIRHFRDLRFTVVAEFSEYLAEFKVYDIEGFDQNETPLWHKIGSPCAPDPVGRIGDAEVFLRGEVKWDGCSNWHFDEQDRVMLHGCSREDLTRLGEVMARCWDWAGEKIGALSP